MRALVFAALALTLAPDIGWGQVVSDIELQAAYCLAVSTSQEAETLQDIRAGTAGQREVSLSTLKSIQERKARFKDYLAAKGYPSERNPLPMKAALERGPKDVASCSKASKEGPSKTCSDRCLRGSRGIEELLECVNRCPSPDSCKRVKKCLENFLPF